MMDEIEKPFPCKTEGCGKSFTNEDHLSVHLKKHDMLLNLSLSGNKANAVFIADQTPTPTRLLKNCEDVGLFDDLQHVNPFEETFRRAVESVATTPITSNAETSKLILADALQNEDTLHTPHVIPYFNSNRNNNHNKTSNTDQEDHDSVEVIEEITLPQHSSQIPIIRVPTPLQTSMSPQDQQREQQPDAIQSVELTYTENQKSPIKITNGSENHKSLNNLKQRRKRSIKNNNNYNNNSNGGRSIVQILPNAIQSTANRGGTVAGHINLINTENGNFLINELLPIQLIPMGGGAAGSITGTLPISNESPSITQLHLYQDQKLQPTNHLPQKKHQIHLLPKPTKIILKNPLKLQSIITSPATITTPITTPNPIKQKLKDCIEKSKHAKHMKLIQSTASTTNKLLHTIDNIDLTTTESEMILANPINSTMSPTATDNTIIHTDNGIPNKSSTTTVIEMKSTRKKISDINIINIGGIGGEEKKKKLYTKDSLKKSAAAAKRYRDKMKLKHTELYKKNTILETENKLLKNEVSRLNAILLSHKNCSLSQK